MASNVVSASSQQPKKGDLISLFALSDLEIMNEIYATHVHTNGKFDVESLFIVVENILKRATQIVDNVVRGPPATVLEHLEEKTPEAGFSPPLCTLKSISCEMQCKAPGEETAYKTTLSILKKLSNYSWDAKAVLTLAAFALDYGEFWLHWTMVSSQSQLTDQLAKSVGHLRSVSVLLNRPTLEKHRQALDELNNVIKYTLEVIKCIFEREKLSSHYDTKDVAALSTGMDHIPVDVFWAIVTVVASTTQFCCLTSDEIKIRKQFIYHLTSVKIDHHIVGHALLGLGTIFSDKKQELSQFSQKLNFIRTKLKGQIAICKQQIEETKAYWKLKKLFLTPTEIMEVFKRLIYFEDNVKPLIDGSTKKPVNIDVLKRKNVLLFMSGLDIIDEDISILRPIYDSIRQNDQYKIVWVPIVDQWTDDLQRKFELLQSKMPWYVVQCFSPIAGIRFVKEDWYFKGKPSVVVLNPQGKVEHENAIHMIRVWGIKAFPFTTVVEETLWNARDWIGSITANVHPNIDNWIKDQKYIFFYGGKDNIWIQQFTERATTLANDATIKEASIFIELVSVGKGSKGEDKPGILRKFWTSIESLFIISKTHRKTDADSVMLEIQKLLSYKNESGWAVLSKGSSVLHIGRGTTILKVVEEFDKWKEFVREKNLELPFIENYNTVVQSTPHTCFHIEIPNTIGRIPENMKCPDCPRILEPYISFRCCHDDITN